MSVMKLITGLTSINGRRNVDKDRWQEDHGNSHRRYVYRRPASSNERVSSEVRKSFANGDDIPDILNNIKAVTLNHDTFIKTIKQIFTTGAPKVDAHGR